MPEYIQEALDLDISQDNQISDNHEWPRAKYGKEHKSVGIAPDKWLDDDIWSPITPFRGNIR